MKPKNLVYLLSSCSDRPHFLLMRLTQIYRRLESTVTQKPAVRQFK